MMLQEVNLEKAMKKAAAGKAVLILTTMDDGSMMIESLSDILQGARFLVEVPAVINEEFEEALPKAVPPDTETDKEKAGRRWEDQSADKPDWCPLKPMPERDDGAYFSEYAKDTSVAGMMPLMRLKRSD